MRLHENALDDLHCVSDFVLVTGLQVLTSWAPEDSRAFRGPSPESACRVILPPMSGSEMTSGRSQR